jgi:diguanylate cyclase (GGDEF)-like protein
MTTTMQTQTERAAFSAASITDDQLQAMWQACGEIANLDSVERACRTLSERLTEIIGGPTAVFRRDVAPWRMIARSAGRNGEAVAGLAVPTARKLEDFARRTPATGPWLMQTENGGADWTPVPLDDDAPSQAVLLLPGNWHIEPVAAWLPRFAQTASLAVRLAACRENSRRGEGLAAVSYSFARKLAQVEGERTLHQFIVDAAAKTVNARLGSISLLQRRDANIAIAATYGYPIEQVGHVRITPGSGIVGGVFTSKKPLLVRDVARVPGLTPRSSRYQTSSFLAVPIICAGESLGVVTLADREDGRPFDRGDVTVVRVLSSLASLALMRQSIACEATELAHMAAIDPLTGLFNRRYLQTRLLSELERARRTGTPLALLMVDVDTFKGINDRLGHQVGDAVLRRVADILRRSIRMSDVCTRYGGDEFSVIVSENAVSATQTAERIRQRMESFRWDSLGIPQNLHVTVSMGVAVVEPGETPDDFLARADRMLYQAKADGRNCVRPALAS